MIPLRDENPTSRAAWVTIVLILINVGVYFLVQPDVGAMDAARFTYEHAAIPCEVTTGEALSVQEINAGISGVDRCARDSSTEKPYFPGKHVLVAILISMFLHGSWLHLAGNMLFLWVFGNNIEDRLGGLRYLFFYLGAGVVATLTHVAMQPSSTVPVVGASGAIAGVMGAYLVWFPNVRVLSFLFFVVARIRAKWWLGFWFLSQFFVNPNSGVAWGAHVGGFVVGALMALLVRPRRDRLTVA